MFKLMNLIVSSLWTASTKQTQRHLCTRYHDLVIKRPSPYCAGVQSPQSQDVFFRTESLNLPTGAFSTCIFLFVESLTCLTGLNLWQTLLSYCRKRGERAVSVAAVAFSFITFCVELNLTETK